MGFKMIIMKEQVQKLRSEKKSLDDIRRILGITLAQVKWALYGDISEARKHPELKEGIFNVSQFENWLV